MVTVIGAGIAGLTVATGLGRAGIPTTVYERLPKSRDGAFLGLGAEVHQALADLGVSAERLLALSYPIESVALIDAQDATAGRTFTPPGELRWHLHRDLLATLLTAASHAGADIRFGTTVAGIDIAGARATVLLADGSTVTDELVVGADGIDSFARQVIEPHRVAVYDGQNVIYALASPTRLPTRPGVMHFHRQCATKDFASSTFLHIHQPDAYANWAVRIAGPAVPADQCGPQPTRVWADRIRRSVPAAHAIVEPLLAATNHIHVTNARNVPLITARAAAPPLVLIGDADHAITPAAGSGGADAIKDAAALIHAITGGRSVDEVMSERRRIIQAEQEQVMRTVRANGW